MVWKGVTRSSTRRGRQHPCQWPLCSRDQEVPSRYCSTEAVDGLQHRVDPSSMLQQECIEDQQLVPLNYSSCEQPYTSSGGQSSSGKGTPNISTSRRQLLELQQRQQTCQHIPPGEQDWLCGSSVGGLATRGHAVAFCSRAAQAATKAQGAAHSSSLKCSCEADMVTAMNAAAAAWALTAALPILPSPLSPRPPTMRWAHRRTSWQWWWPPSQTTCACMRCPSCGCAR